MTLVLALPACGGGGGGGGTVIPPAVTCGFTSNDGAAAANNVRFTDNVTVAGDICTVEVAIGGPTTDSDYYAFAFDIQIADTTVAQFINGSDTAGPFLTGTVDSQVSQPADRVVVGVSKVGGILGNGTGAAEEVVLTLSFRALKVGSTTLTFLGSPANPALGNCTPQGPEAIDDALPGDCIDTETWGAGATITGTSS
jgi:hypothetical protein